MRPNSNKKGFFAGVAAMVAAIMAKNEVAASDGPSGYLPNRGMPTRGRKSVILSRGYLRCSNKPPPGGKGEATPANPDGPRVDSGGRMSERRAKVIREASDKVARQQFITLLAMLEKLPYPVRKKLIAKQAKNLPWRQRVSIAWGVVWGK